MLNLFNIKEKNKAHAKHIDIGASLPVSSQSTGIQTKEKKTLKHFPSAIREWNNSIYVFNKNSVNLIPSVSNLANKLIKSYFNIYNRRLELKMRTKKLLLRLRRLSSNKFYVSNGAFKHTNNKVCVNLYVFNRQKVNYLLTLKKWFLKTLLSKSRKLSKPSYALQGSDLHESRSLSKSRKLYRLHKLYGSRKSFIKKDFRKIIMKKIKHIRAKGIQKLIEFNANKYLLIKAIKTINNTNKYNVDRFNTISLYTKNFHKALIKKSLKRIRMLVYYKQLIYLNKSKLNYTYLQYLKKHLEKIYNKNVEFNIINLRKFYLNSDILSESMALKLAKNRRKMTKYINRLKEKVKILGKNVNLALTTTEEKANKSCNLSTLSYIEKKANIQKHVINSLKYRHVTGFRLEAKGRLTKRFTASRSIHKLRYKGNLLNADSSYKGLSSVLLKGNLRSNTQYTNIGSKSRIGSFGIKGWISGN